MHRVSSRHDLLRDEPERGELEPDQIVTPGIYVKRIVEGETYERRIERRTVQKA